MSPATPDPAVAPALRRVLDDAGYTEDAVRAVFGPPLINPTRHEHAALRARVSGGSNLDVLLDVFLVGGQRASADVAAALGALDLATAERAGVLTITSAGVSAACRLTPVRGVVVASDAGPDDGPGVTADHVPGVVYGALLAADLTGAGPLGRVLDVGTGSGVLAALVAGRATEVVATDLSGRAGAFAAFTARLNGADTISVRVGDGLDPVAGETFDVIVSNPPCAISPDRELLWRDGVRDGPGFVADLVGRVAGHLRPDGSAFILASWGHGDADHPTDALRPWLPAGARAALVRAMTMSADNYAAAWWPAGPDEDRQRWRQYLADLGYAHVSLGAVVLRGGGPAVVHVVDIDPSLGPPLGDLLASVW